METFDARSKKEELKIETDSGDVVIVIYPITAKKQDVITKINSRMQKTKDPKKIIELYLEILSIICPEMTEEDALSIMDIDYGQMINLAQRVYSMSLHIDLEEAEKKILVPKKRQSSRSRRRASA